MPVIVGGLVLAGLGCNGRLLMPRILKPSTHGLLFRLVWVVGWWVHAALSIISRKQSLNIIEPCRT